MALKPLDPAYQRDMMAKQPYPDMQADSDKAKSRARIEFISSRFTDFRSSDHFTKYEKKCRTIRRLINQDIPPELKKSKFNIVTGLMRGSFDNLRDFVQNAYDQDEIFNLTSMVADPAKKKLVDDLNEYQINFFNAIKYKKHVFRVSEWMIEQGWAISHTYYQPRNGWATKPQADPDAPGGIRWTQEQDKRLGKPKSNIINPRNWAGSLNHHIDDQPYQIFVKRWVYSDVIRAMAMKNEAGAPIYNLDALNKLKVDFEKKQTGGGKMEYIQDGPRDEVGTRGDNNKKSSDPTYVDVLYYSGPLSEVRGHEGDDNRYFVEATDKLELRFHENQMDEEFSELVHFQSHSDKSSPFSMSPLDPMINYEKVNSFLISLGLEGQVDSMTRYLQVYEDDFINPEVLSNPKHLVNMLRAKDANAKPPMWVEPGRSASLDDLTKIFQVLDRWGQRVGTTDQEMGVLGGTQDKTATAANILMSAASKKNQAFLRRLSDGFAQEAKQALLLDLMYSDMRTKATYSRDGQAIKLTPEHVEAFVSGSMIRVTDWITRDRGQELQKVMNAMTVTKDILMGLGSPDPAVRMARDYLKTAGMKDIDNILPDPDKVDLSKPPAPPPVSTGPMNGPPNPPPQQVGPLDNETNEPPPNPLA